MEIDARYMARALQLARNGLGYASPNPMVGAVIVADGKIVGEGWHRRCGCGHAEVNAVASVKDPDLLKRSTMYVTLEPCSHYGKTPPCAKLIIDKQIPRVVVGCLDPFAKVSGRGVAMLREAGVEVEVGVMEEECKALNHVFMYAHTHGRPWVTLKWACSADGYLDHKRNAGEAPAKFSNPLGTTLVHLMRSRYDAIMAGSGTVIADNCSLTVRLTEGKSPVAVVLDRRGRIDATAAVLRPGTLIVSYEKREDLPEGVEQIFVSEEDTLEDLLHELYKRNITSLMVEGGATLLNEFIAKDLWQEARVEQSSDRLGARGKGHVPMPSGEIMKVMEVGNNKIFSILNTRGLDKA